MLKSCEFVSFSPINKSVKIEENPQFNAKKNMISKIKNSQYTIKC